MDVIYVIFVFELLIERSVELPSVLWSLGWHGANSETDLKRSVFYFYKRGKRMKTPKPYGHSINVKIHPFTTATIAIIVISLLMFVGNLNIYKVEADATLPPGIITSVPIILTNDQSVATPSPFQQMITIHNASYSSEEASNLQNMEFFDGTGSVIPSWLESGSSNSSTNTIYWLKLANGIPANSSVTIYMGFADTTTNLFNNQSTGEAPQLSPIYGQYDDGGNVFNYYNNFASALSSWSTSTGVSTSISNGLTVNFSQNGYFVGPTEDIGTAFDADIAFNPSEINIGYININQTTSYLGGPGWAGSVIREACGNTYPDQLDQNGEMNSGGSVSGSIIPGSESVNGIFSVIPFSPVNSFQYVNYSSGSSFQPISAHPPQYPCQVGFAQMRNGNINTTLQVQWVRVRGVPANGIMPIVNIAGNISSTTTTLTSSVNPSIAGQPITFIASVTPIPDGGSVQFQDNGETIVSPTINPAGQVSFTSYNVSVGSHSITASYSGDSNFAPSTDTITQVVNSTTGPLINIWITNINGLCLSMNGVTLPTVPGTVITGVIWDWGDGQTNPGSMLQNHTYSAIGNYTVTATATDSKGQSKSETAGVSITQTTTQTATTLAASYNPSYSGGPVTFTAKVSPIPPGGTVQFFVDGNSVGNFVPVDSNGQANYNTSSLSSGNHAISANYSGYNDFSSSSGTCSQVVNTSETPSILTWLNGSVTGLTVPVNGVTLPNPSVPGAVITGVVWNWGDGQIMPGWMLQTHTYSQPGNYTIITTATDDYGQSNSASLQVTVAGPTINTPLFAGATTISGMSIASAVVTLSVNGIAQAPVIADASTAAWTVNLQNPLVYGDNISATAQISGQPSGSPVLANVVAPISDIANLSGLVVGPTTLSTISPAFSPSIYNYTESLTSTYASVMATWTQSNATVTFNGTQATSGTYTTLPLNLGPNTITIMVTMPKATEIYTVIVTRVTGPLINIVVVPGPSSNLAMGATLQFTAIGLYRDGSTEDLTQSAVWTSDTTNVATVSPVGFAVGVTTGTAYVTAGESGITSPAVGLIVGTPITTPITSSIPTRNESLANGFNGVNPDQTTLGYTVGLKSDGTVVAAGIDKNGDTDVSSWQNIIQLTCGYYFTVGLKSNGTVVATGLNNFGQCDVASWNNIIQVSAGSNFVVGLKSDGTVVAAGYNGWGQCNVGSWTDIVQVSAFASFVVGLESNGTVVATGLNNNGQCNVNKWTGIKQVAAGGAFAIGLESNGSVVAVGNNLGGQCNVGSWAGITQIAAGNGFTMGLESNGSVVYTGSPTYNQAGSWTDISQLGGGWDCAMGLKSDGTVVAVGSNPDSAGAASWNLGCGTVTSIQGGGTISPGDWVTVIIKGANNQTSLEIGATDYGGTAPSGQSDNNLEGGSQNYDVKATLGPNFGADATATIIISDSSVTANSTIQFLYNNQWNTATNIVINTSQTPPTISGDVPVAYLTGTPFAIGFPTLNSITVTPNPSNDLAVGATEQFTAIGAFSDGIKRNITSKVTWTSSDTTKATITTPGGSSTGVTVGAINITATLNAINSSQISLTVIPASTSTTGANAMVVYSGSNQTVNLTATVTTTGVTVNEGVVTFTVQNGNTVIGKPVTSGTVIGGSANATYTLPGGTPAAKYTIVASYSGGADFNASIDNTRQLTVNQAPDQTFVISIPNPSAYGSQVTFTAMVLPSSINPSNIITSNNGISILNTSSLATILGNYIPTGSITFMDGTTTLNTVKLSKLGFVTFSMPFLAAGNHSITAKYLGDTNYLSSVSGTLTQKINKANTTLSLLSSLNPAKSGNTVTFTAKVTWSVGTPTGTVTFKDNSTGKTLGTGSLSADGHATFSISSLSKGTHSITAEYAGDDNFDGCSSSAFSQVIK